MSEKFCVKLVSIIAVLFLLSVGNGYASWDNYWHSQCDSRWANTKMGNSTPSDDTIGKYGCALTCVAILHQVEKNGSSSDVTPATLNTWLTNTSGGYAYDKDGYALINWGKAADMDGLGGLSYYGSDDTWDNWLYLDDQLSAGRKVIVKVDFTPTTSDIVQHWVLVVEKNGSSAQPSSYKILDPWPTSYESRTLAYYYDANYDNTFFSSRTYSGTWDVNSTPQNNTLIRANGDTKVYWLQDNVRYHVASEAIAQAQTDAGIPGWTWPTVNVYDASKINQYTEGPEFIANNSNSDGLLIRQTGTNSVYVMIDGKRRWICSNEALDWKGVNWDPDVIEVAAKIISDYVPTQRADIYGLGEGETNSTIKNCFKDAYTCNENNSYCASPSTWKGWPGKYSQCLGFPKTTVGNANVSGCSGISGKYQTFDYGTINYTTQYGTFEVHGAIFEKYKSLSYSESQLGFPVSDEYQWSSYRRSDFEGGYIYWDSSTDQAYVIYTTLPEPPSKATSPSPSNGATGISINTDISWSNGGGATSYDVYFGTDSTPDIGESKGNQTSASYDPGTLSYNTTYYWRIDAKNSDGTTTGDVWYFTTQEDTSIPSMGSIRVSIVPQEAADAEAQWRVLGESSWRNSGTIKSDVPFGTYTIEFKDISGWNTPPNKDVTVFAAVPDPWINSDLYVDNTQTCTYNISHTSKSFGSSGGSDSVSITTQSDCSWTAVSYDDWITITSGSSGSGDGTVDYSVSSNSSASLRTGTMTIAGETFTVTQTESQIPVPTVMTTDIDIFSINTNSASSGGTVISDGGADVTARGVCWSTSVNPTISDSHTLDGTGIGNFTSSITGLTLDTSYHVRAYATNIVGTGYGNDLYFVTTLDPDEFPDPTDVPPLDPDEFPDPTDVPPLDPDGLSFLFTDDFQDNNIDSSKWEYSGNSVTEESGIMKVEAEIIDQVGLLKSKWISVNTEKPLIITRRTKVHYENQYFDGGMSIHLDQLPGFGISYCNYAYTGNNEIQRFGFFLSRNGASAHSGANQEDVSDLIDPIWDEWFLEKMIYNPVSGLLEYFINDEKRIEYNVGGISSAESAMMQIEFSTWGWWTGHYHYFDDFIVYQEPAEMAPVKGDINGDGDVGISDAILALQIASGITPNSAVYKLADVNGDGRIGIEEAIYILQKVAGLRSD